MKYLTILTLCFAIFACSDKKSPDSSIEAIKKLESNASLAKSDTLINSYINFSNQFPDHKLAPLFLFKAAQACVKNNQALKGVKLYEQLASVYEKDSLAPEATICAAVGFQGLQDPANAKRLFDGFVKKYPNHPRVEEVKKMSEFVGLSDEELIRRFNEQILNNSDSSNLN